MQKIDDLVINSIFFSHLFVCGAGRSGTTFLWRILNNSKNINLATEIHFFSSLYHRGFLYNYKKLKYDKISHGKLLNNLIFGNHFGMYWENKRTFTRQEIDRYFFNKNISTKNIYQLLLEHDLSNTNKPSSGIKYIGEKTPLNIFHVERLYQWFPESYILFIFRNPIEVLMSEVNKKSKPDYFLNKNNFLYAFGLSIFVFIEWFLSATIALYFQKRKKDKFLIIDYHQLKANQIQSIKKICSQIGIDFDKNLCVYKKIGSSYKNNTNHKFWQPSTFHSAIYSFFLGPILHILKKKSLNNHSKKFQHKDCC